MSTILLPRTRPNFIMIEVETMLSTSFCAVPDFMRVLPVTNSGPTTAAIGISHAAAIAESGLQTTHAVSMPSFRAFSIAPRT